MPRSTPFAACHPDPCRRLALGGDLLRRILWHREGPDGIHAGPDPRRRKWEVVQGVPVDAFSQEKIDLTIGELKEERDAVKGLIPG